ncbi:MAG: CARDB domain-containing protein, partial [Dehalococcoidia bacterium]
IAWRYFSVLIVLMLALGTGWIALMPGTSGASTAAQGPTPVANIAVQSASLSTSRVTPRSPVYVTADVANTGTATGSANIKLYVNDNVATDQTVTLHSGGRTTITFNVSCVDPGKYYVYVDNVPAGIFEVDRFGDTNVMLYLGGALIFFALAGAMVFAVSRSPLHR